MPKTPWLAGKSINDAEKHRSHHHPTKAFNYWIIRKFDSEHNYGTRGSLPRHSSQSRSSSHGPDLRRHDKMWLKRQGLCLNKHGTRAAANGLSK
jgi:hypothetical protein